MQEAEPYKGLYFVIKNSHPEGEEFLQALPEMVSPWI